MLIVEGTVGMKKGMEHTHVKGDARLKHGDVNFAVGWTYVCVLKSFSKMGSMVRRNLGAKAM